MTMMVINTDYINDVDEHSDDDEDNSYRMFRIRNLDDNFSDTFDCKWNSALTIC